jgi:hypothetical protein
VIRRAVRGVVVGVVGTVLGPALVAWVVRLVLGIRLRRGGWPARTPNRERPVGSGPDRRADAGTPAGTRTSAASRRVGG